MHQDAHAQLIWPMDPLDDARDIEVDLGFGALPVLSALPAVGAPVDIPQVEQQSQCGN